MTLGNAHRLLRATAVQPLRTVARLSLVAAGLGAVLATSPWSDASAAPAAGYKATFLAEAWYRTAPVDTSTVNGCGIPVAGCAPLPTNTVPTQYPTGTLHVGVSGGAEDSRTYVTLVGETVPFGTDVVGGTLRLPLDMDPQAGVVAPDTASFRACLVQGKVTDGVEGGLYGAPTVDCTTSSAAVFTPSQGSSSPVFTISLTPFANALTAGEVSLGLVPGENPGTAWHVAFARADSTAHGTQPISAQLLTSGAQASGETTDSFARASSPPPGSSNAVPPATPGLADAPVPPAQAGIAPVVAGREPAIVARPVAALNGSIASPLVFLLPLAFAAACAWVARVFTRDLLPVRG